MNLSKSQKKYLRKRGHQLNPVILVADSGLSKTVLQEFDSTIAHVDRVQVQPRYPNLILSPVNVIFFLYCSPIGLPRNEMKRIDFPLLACRPNFIKALKSPGSHILKLQYLRSAHWMDNRIK